MSKEKSQPEKLPVLKNEPARGTGAIALFHMLVSSLEGSKILQNGDVRADMLIDLAATLNSLHPENKDDLREVAALGPYRIVVATSYKSIGDIFKLGLERLFLQSKLSKQIGDVLTKEGVDWKTAANITRPHTRPKEKQERPEENHTAIARRDIAATFDRFKEQLTSEEGMPATILTVEMIYKIMTDTVFGGYTDEEIAKWKDDIVYYLQHLIDVQQAYVLGVFTENLPKTIQRTLMRLVAKMQGVSGTLENMLRIEDELFPQITQWIEAQQEKNLTEDKLKAMGILGAVLIEQRKGRSMEKARSDIFGIYMAALDSTANAANWLLAEFAQHPEILGQVARREGDARTQYIKFILFELWRKDPITPIIFRQVPAGKGITMPDGTFLKPGDIVLLSVGAAGEDEVRFPNPKVFDPDRYYRMSAKEIEQVELDLDLVFARDKHKCQGQKIANSTLDEFARFLAENFDRIEIVPTKKGEKINPVSNNSGVCGPVDEHGNGLMLRAIPKEDTSAQQSK